MWPDALVTMYLPYERTVYDLEDRSGNAKRIRRWRERKDNTVYNEPIINALKGDGNESIQSAAIGLLISSINSGGDWKGSYGALWKCIVSYAGYPFATSGRGKEHRGAVEFTYEIKISSRTGEKTDEMIISSRPDGKTITRSSVELALERYLAVQEECGYVKGPKAAGQIFGASYLYAVFIAWGVIRSTSE